MSYKKLGFTLMEIMIVIIIIGVIVGLTFPQYQKTIQSTYEREAIRNLTMIHAAQQIYNAREGNFWPEDSNNHGIADINAAFSLNIIPDGLTYNCVSTNPGTTFTCTAVRQAPAPSFTVTVTQAVISSTNPQCTAGACP